MSTITTTTTVPSTIAAATTATETSIKAPDIENTFVSMFIETLQQLIQTVVESFKNCKKSRAILELFNESVMTDMEKQINITERWHLVMKPHYEAVDAELRTEETEDQFLEAISTLPLLSSLNVRRKWKYVSEDPMQRATFLEYIIALNGFAGMHDGLPKKIRQNISTITEDLGRKIHNCQVDPRSLQAVRLGKQVMKGTGEAEATHIYNNFDDIFRGIPAFRKQASRRNGQQKNPTQHILEAKVDNKLPACKL